MFETNDLIKFRGFFGMIKLAAFPDLQSLLLYFTNLCASVATNVIPSFSNEKYTPLITGLNSSLPVAKTVLLIALKRIPLSIFNEEEDSISGSLGNSSPFVPANLYLPVSEETSIPKDLASTEKVSGWSENVLSISRRSFAGIQTFISSSALSRLISEIIVDSKSEPETTNFLSFTSNK